MRVARGRVNVLGCTTGRLHRQPHQIRLSADSGLRKNVARVRSGGRLLIARFGCERRRAALEHQTCKHAGLSLQAWG